MIINSSMSKPFAALVLLSLLPLLPGCTSVSPAEQARVAPALAKESPEIPTDEHLVTVVVEDGPFFINSLYLSGEGPGRIKDIAIEDLIANKETVWTEPSLGLSDEMVSSNAENPRFKAALAAQNGVQETPQRADAGAAPRLYWFRGAKLEIIEDGKVLPHPEFLCHSLVSFDGLKHWDYFPYASSAQGEFMFNFSQGITNIVFPAGYAIPMNGKERLTFAFKSLNRTSDATRIIKCRWTLYLVPDDELTQPMQALNWYHSGIFVLVGGAKSKNRLLPGGCGGASKICGIEGMGSGKVPANDVWHNQLNQPFEKNEKGEEITGHWVIPPGRHRYLTMHPEYPLNEIGPIVAAGAHVHPFCEKMSLIEKLPGKRQRTIFTLNSQTDTSQGIRIKHIDYLTWPSGFNLSKNEKAQYGWETIYNNTTAVDQDSMAGATLYFSDPKFQKPEWASEPLPAATLSRETRGGSDRLIE